MAKLEKIGKYEILGQIAAGGFGVVYKARDPFIKRLVAIKTCPADNEDLRNRFFREAEIVGNLKHPNITIVHDFGVEGDFAYLVQEYLSGEDLLAKIRDKRALELDEKLEILLQVAQGLGYAHSQGVIHRDVKPGNIRVLEDSKVKIMDFGIAKLITARTQLTQKGMTVGTVGYLAPEQVSDGEVTQRTDIFGFGVLSYEFLTYRRPFRGRTLGELIPRIMREEPQAISTLVVDAPATLDELVRRCLAKDPGERYASFDEVISELGGILSEAQLVAALPGDVVERTVRLEPVAATGAARVVPTAPSERTQLTPIGVMAAPAAPPVREQTLREEPQRAAVEPLPTSDAEMPTLRTSPRRPADSPAPPAAKEPFEDTRPVILPEEVQAMEQGAATGVSDPGAPWSAPEELLPPDPDLSMSGFAPPPLPPAPASFSGDGSGSNTKTRKATGSQLPPAAIEPSPVIGGVDESPVGERLGVGRLLVVLAAGLVAVVALVLGIYFLLGKSKTPKVVGPTPAVVPVVAPTEPAVRAEPGTLLVTASPWGVVERIIADDGTEVIGAPFGATPRVIELQPGRYRVEVSHPDLPERIECQVEVSAVAAGQCAVVTSAMDVNTYFREAGWWR